MKKIIPYIIILMVCFVTLILWFASKNNFDLISEQPLRSLSQITALIGIVFMALSLLLSTRLKIVENLFGGLDKTYFAHHFLGSISFIFLINHPLMLAVQALPNLRSSLLYLLPGADLVYNLGIFGIYFMILSFLFMVFFKLPYHLWRVVHRLLGFSFLLGSVHTLLITGDVSSYPPLRLWISLFILIGFVSTVYIVFLYRQLGPKYLYRVDKITRVLDIINFYLKPVTKRSLNFAPGQFVYLEFENQQIGQESHPFSISSAPHEESIRISAKILGDYTLKLPNLKEGDKLFVYGPYGKFASQTSSPHQGNTLWVGGGIGITPFLSMLQAEAYKPSQKKITFFYCYRNEEEGIFCQEITQLVQMTGNVNFVNWCSSKMKRLTGSILAQSVDLKLLDSIYLCGPVPMMETLTEQLKDLDISEEKIFFENFSFLD